MPKVMQVEGSGRGRFIFYCPACQCHHYFDTIGEQPTWIYNNNPYVPTVHPSIISYQPNEHGPIRCHLFIEGGKIRYLKDCTHSMRGGVVDMSEEKD